MKRLLIAAAAALAGCAATSMPPPVANPEEIPVHVVELENVRLRLMPGPCSDAHSLLMAAQAGPHYAERWRAIQSTWQGTDGSWRDFAGCWLEASAEEAGAPGEVLVLVFEDYTSYVVLKRDLVKTGGSGA